MNGQGFSSVAHETVQEYWDNRPCNIYHSTRERGTKEYFDEVEKRKYFVEPHIVDFAEFGKWKNKKVLEIGCGIGTDTINFARAGAKVTAIDMSKSSIDVAQQRAKVFGLDNISFYHGNAEELSQIVPVEEYDLIYSFGVIHHTPFPYKVADEIRKYMHANTLFKMMVYNRYSWKALGILMHYGKGAFWRWDGLIARYSEAQEGCPVTYAYTRKTVKSLLQGFEVINCKIDHIFPYSIPEYKKYEYKKVWYFRYLPKNLFHMIEKKWGWHLCVTCKLG